MTRHAIHARVKRSPSWAKHLATAFTSITIAWIGAWQTAKAQAPNVNSYPYDKEYIQHSLVQHTQQLSSIDRRLNTLDVDVAHANTLLEVLVNGGSFRGK